MNTFKKLGMVAAGMLMTLPLIGNANYAEDTCSDVTSVAVW